jgi:GT2 family glycosyltransferase
MTTQSHEPLVSIITLNYNQPTVTRAFLQSTLSLDYPSYEILVCDMASDQDPGVILEPEKFPHVRLLRSPKNLGFAGGNNWGMRQARGEYLFIVNNDTEVTPGLLRQLLAPFATDPSIGVTCPKIKYYDAPNIIQYAGFKPMNKFTGRTSTIGDLQQDRGQFDQSGPAAGAHGCAMMVKREVVEKTGMFPEVFFLYYEEWDWTARIHKAGYRIWYTAQATIYHKESMSVGKQNPIKVYYHTRNRILYMRRNQDLLHLLVFTIYFGLITIPWSILRYIANGQYEELKWFIKGVWWNLYSSKRSEI